MAKSQFRPAVSAFLLMVTMSLIFTALSFFVVPVCSDLGFGRGSYLPALIAMPFLLAGGMFCLICAFRGIED